MIVNDYQTQQEEQEQMNIYQRMISAMSELKYIQKADKPVAGQYRAVRHDDVTAACHKVFVKFGIYCEATVLRWKVVGNRTEVTMKLTFINIDKPEDRFEQEAFGFGVDNQDKGPGKAVSYAYKYGLLKAFALETGDDPDDVQDSEADFKSDLALAIETLKGTINTIKEGISEGNLEKAAEAWFELSKDEKTSIWAAPSKGGPFTTEERKIIKSTEFRESHFNQEVA